MSKFSQPKRRLLQFAALTLALICAACGGGAATDNASSALAQSEDSFHIDESVGPGPNPSFPGNEIDAFAWSEESPSTAPSINGRVWYLQFIFGVGRQESAHDCARELGGAWETMDGEMLPTVGGYSVYYDAANQIQSQADFKFRCGDQHLIEPFMPHSSAGFYRTQIELSPTTVNGRVVLSLPAAAQGRLHALLMRFSLSGNPAQNEVYLADNDRFDISISPGAYETWRNSGDPTVIVLFDTVTDITTTYNLQYNVFATAPSDGSI